MAQKKTTLFGSWLRNEMTARGITVSDLACAADISLAAIYWWLRGHAHPSEASQRRLAHGLGIGVRTVTGVVIRSRSEDAGLSEPTQLFPETTIENKVLDLLDELKRNITDAEQALERNPTCPLARERWFVYRMVQSRCSGILNTFDPREAA